MDGNSGASTQDNSGQSFESYKKVKVLGQGSFGKAFLVQAESDGQYAVIKKIDIKSMSEQEKRDTIKEAKILEVLQHPNIIRFKEVYKTKKGQLCIVMDYADGGDLQKKIKEARDGGMKYITEDQILSWFTQICLAMKHCHDRKILHRDLKSGNIFLTGSGIVKLGDFGIAKVLSNTVEKAVTIVGTPYYLSPEIINNKPYSFKSDLWSLGVLLYEMCALKPPFNGANIHMLAMQIVRGQYSALPTHYSYELRGLVNKMLNQDPNKRPNINQLLNEKVLRDKIKNFLSKSSMQEEFSHTLLHKQNVFDRYHNKLAQSVEKQQIRPPAEKKNQDQEFENFVVQRQQHVQMPTKSQPAAIQPKQTLGVNKAAQDVLAKINQIELGNGPNVQKQPPPFIGQNQLVSKEQKRMVQKQTSNDRNYNRGESNLVIKGNNQPYKHYQDNDNMQKIKEYKNKMQSHYQDAQAKRQAELENKRQLILQNMNRKAEQEKAKKEKQKKDVLKSQRIKEQQKEQKLNDREAERKRMREDMQKRKAMASKKKGTGGDFEIAGADHIQDLLNESVDLPPSEEEQIMQSSKDYFSANKNARVEKVQKDEPTVAVPRRMDPFKADAKKYDRAGWGNVKQDESSGENSRKSDKQIKKFKGVDDVEIFISDKDQAKIQKRQVASYVYEEEYERQRVQELEENFQKYNQYIDEILNSGQKQDEQQQDYKQGLMMGGFDSGGPSDQAHHLNSVENTQYDHETNFTSDNQSNMPNNYNYQFQTDLADQEIDFDKLLGDAIISQAEYDEDREDQFEDDDDDGAADKGPKNFGDDSLAFSMSMPKVQQPPEPMPQVKQQQYEQQEEDSAINYFQDRDQNSKDAMMWEYVIDRHGKKEFDAVYKIVKKYDVDRFSDEGQKQIAIEAKAALTPLGMTDETQQADLIGLVSSFIIIEEFKQQTGQQVETKWS